MSRFVRLLLIVALVIANVPLGVLLPVRTVQAQTSNEAEVTGRLKAALDSLDADVFEALAAYEAVGQPIPFTDTSPGSELKLGDIFGKAVERIGTHEGVDSLLEDMKNLSTLDVEGVEVRFTNVTTDTPRTFDVVDILAFDFVATTTTSVPLALAKDDLVLNGSDIPLTVSLSVPFAFGYDDTASSEKEMVYLTNLPTIAVSVTIAAPDVTPFHTIHGFTDLTVDGDIAVNLAINATLEDPDGNNRLTWDEWAVTAPQDLFDVNYIDGPDMVIDGELTLDSGIIDNPPDQPDGFVKWEVENLTNSVIPDPKVVLGNIVDFTHVSADEVFEGIVDATTALLAAQQVRDMPLPFLKGELSDVVTFAAPLVEFAHEFGDAAIVCGISVVNEQDIALCQAFTLYPIVSGAEWTVGGGTHPAGDSVGPNPTSTVQLPLGVEGLDGIRLTFTFDGDTEKRTARPLFLTAEQLKVKLEERFGVSTKYDPSTHALTYNLQADLPPASKVISADIGDQLQNITALTNLHQTDGEITVEASNVKMDVSFGIIMVKDPRPLRPDGEGTDADRFFLQVSSDPNVPEFQADVTASANSEFALEGRLDFLEVGTAAATLNLTKSDGGPSLALNINAPGISVLTGTIPNAIAVRDLLTRTLASHITVQCELALDSALNVQATINDNDDVLAAGAVNVNWLDVFADECTPNLDPQDLLALKITLDDDPQKPLSLFHIDSDNPQALLSLVLDAIAGFVQKVDALKVGTDDESQLLPLLGVSPRELLDSLEDLNRVLTNDLRTGPAGSLQELQTELNKKLGDGEVTFALENQAGTGMPALTVKLVYDKHHSITKVLNLELDSNGRALVAIGQEGTITADTGINMHLDVQIPLKKDSSLDEVSVLPTTGVSATVNLDHPVNLQAAAGPLQVKVDGTAELSATIGVRDNRTEALPLTEWGDDLDITPLGNAQASLTLNDGTLGTISYSKDLKTGAETINGLELLNSDIASRPLELALLFNALPALTTKLKGLLTQGAEDVSVPGLGEALDAGADVVGVIEREVITPLNAVAIKLDNATKPDSGNVQPLDTSDELKGEIKTLVEQEVGVLATGTNVAVDVICAGGASDCPVAQINDITISFTIGQTDEPTSPHFEIGIDGLPVKIGGAMTGKVTWELPITIGLSRDQGPYVAVNSAMPLLEVTAEVGIGESDNCIRNDDSFPPEIEIARFSKEKCLTGKLAFLNVEMYDGKEKNGDEDSDPTNIFVATSLGLPAGVNSTRLTAANIGNGISLEPSFEATSNIDLALRTSTVEGDKLPSVVGALHVTWDIDTNNGVPTVKFDQLQLNVGSFATDLLDPVVGEVREVTSPLEPIVDFAQAEVPILSQLADLTGQARPTVLDLIKEAYPEQEEKWALVESVIAFVVLANELPKDEAKWIALGGDSSTPGMFELDGSKLMKGKTTPDNADSLFLSSTNRENLVAELNGNGNDKRALADQAARDTRPTNFGVKGLDFPFLDDSRQIFAMLLGQDVDIVAMDFGEMDAVVAQGYSYGPIFMGPFPVTAGINVSFKARARFAMGYSTRGLRENGDLLQGLYLDDYNSEGVDVDEWNLLFRVDANAALGGGVAEVGAFGGVDTIISGNLNDPTPDGRLYYDEVAARLEYPLCLFDVSGRLDLFLGLYAEVDTLVWSERWEKEIMRATLLNFDEAFKQECDTQGKPPPNLADAVNGDLILNVGVRWERRFIAPCKKDKDGNLLPCNEQVTVRQVTDTKFAIEAFGIKQERDGITGSIVATASTSSLVINLVNGVNASGTVSFTRPARFIGGAGNDSFTGGNGDDYFEGGGGQDTLVGGIGSDTIHGGGDADRIDGGIGDDVLHGDSGNDAISGGPGSDEIYGDDDNDSLLGGPWTDIHLDGVDIIVGGWGDDTIDGGLGNDGLYGDEMVSSVAIDKTGARLAPNDFDVGCRALGTTVENEPEAGKRPGKDILLGGLGNDILVGGNNDDRLYGNEDNDLLCGNGGNDFLDGDDDDDDTGDASDRDDSQVGGFAGGLFGGPGIDHLYGRGGNDELFGGSEKDYMYGGLGDDTMHGEEHDDEMYGDAGLDKMYGNLGNDIMHGGDGDDTMEGNGDNDEMYGDAGNDKMYGNLGDDIMRGGADEDTMYGNIDGGDGIPVGATDDDEMYGDAGNDKMYGNVGIDTMRGNQGDDYMEGNADGDEMYGDAGMDKMYGNAGDDIMRGGADVDTMHGDANDDEMYGNAGNDLMYGNDHDDKMYGNTGDDYMEGNAGIDEMHGDAGQDDMIGGSPQPNSADDGDKMYGGTEQDVMIGDNGTISRPGGSEVDGTAKRIVAIYDLGPNNPDVDVVGGDYMEGNAGNDDMYGGGEDDTMHGNLGEDYMEGHAGIDTMYGDEGQDDMIGGSPQPGYADEGDKMYGGAQADVMLGDNGLIARRPLQVIEKEEDFWEVDPNRQDFIRDVTLYDVEHVDGPNVASTASGMDKMWGDGDDDLMFGQGGGDEMHGGTDYDYMEGNAGTDLMYGDAGEDDLVGGGSAADGIIVFDATPQSTGNGLLDTDDVMYGDDGDGDETNGDDGDILAGDNARIDRILQADSWQFEQIDANTQNLLGTVTLFDIEFVGGPAVDPATHGSDTMWGDGGRDYMFGQGNNDVDDDGDGRVDEDPADGIDNDRDGRESAGSVGFDCRDGFDNDNDGTLDSNDPDCQAAIDEDGKGDELHGGGGDDVMEGNHGGDLMYGDAGQDDMLGGNSAGPDGVVGGGIIPTGLLDGDDTMYGDSGDAAVGDADVLLADNGLIVRITDNDLWLRLQGGNGYDVVRRSAMMTTQTPEPPGAFGNDYLRGNGGVDDMYGQQGSDFMAGDHGDDALVGDLGLIVNNLLGENDDIPDPGLDQEIAPNEPFFSDTIYPADSLHRLVQLFLFREEDGAFGDDTMLGGDGDDTLHGGAGADIMNGDGDGLGGDANDPNPDTVDEDHLFGGKSNDVIWGGRGHDHLWGGYGDDVLDVLPRPSMTIGNGKNDKGKQTTHPADPPEWFTYGASDNFQDIDYIYGGWGQDAMQADVADEGPIPGDRLIDWVGAYNVYYLCPGVYGEYVTTRDHSPAVIEFLQQLSAGDGAYEVLVDGSSGNDELAMVFSNQAGQNSHPVHPDTPGHFTCEEVAASSVVQSAERNPGPLPQEETTDLVVDDATTDETIAEESVTDQATVDEGMRLSLPIVTTARNGESEETHSSSITLDQSLFLPVVTRNR